MEGIKVFEYRIFKISYAIVLHYIKGFEVRKLVTKHYENHKSLGEISEFVNRSRSTV